MSATVTSVPRRIRLVVAAATTVAAGAIAWRRAATPVAVRRAFDAWRRGEGSIYNLMDDDAQIIIPGTATHCGTYRKDVFLREVATPFIARFAEPPVPRLRALWTNTSGVAVLADASGITRDGQPYCNTYVFMLKAIGRRVTEVTEFLDMAAFEAVWDRVELGPAHDK